MNTSSQWLGLSLVVCSAACGSSFQANDSAATGGSPSGGNASGGNASGGSGSAAGSDNGGRGGKGGKGGSGGSVSTGGNLGIAGDVSVVGGGMGVSGGSGAGGVAGNAGSMSGGGPSGGRSSGGSSSGGSSSGGAAGSATAGTGGGSGASCTELWSSYQDFVAKTAVCDAGSTVECVANNAIVDQCNCAVPFNHDSASLSGAKKALQDWKDAGCVFKPCGCLTQGTPACLITSGTTAYTCQFGPAVIQM